jgi:anti-sigma-K factor RskA
MNDKHVFDLIPAYALGCLDPDEKNQVEAHLVECALCKDEWTSYLAVVDRLAVSPSQINPPRHLKESIMGAVEGNPARPPLRQKSPVPEVNRPTVGRRWQDWVRMLLPVWGIASLVLVIALGVTNILLLQQVQNKPQPGKIIFSDFQIVPLSGTSSAPKATGILVISQDGMAGSLNVDGLQPLDPAHQYQLWLIDQGKRTSGGVFSVNQQGYGSLKVNSSRPLVDYGSFGITIEPAGGSPGPTGDKVLGGNL